jgi:hypothetical protein
MVVMKVISGAQTGADRAGLEWAKANGIPTGGWMPAGFRAEDGKHPEFAEMYGIQCTSDWRYPPRTKLNVQQSTGTIIFGNINSAGCRLTKKYCDEMERPWIHIPFPWPKGGVPVKLYDFLVLAGMERAVINVAGNREEKNPGIGAFVKSWMDVILKMIETYKK